MKNALLLVDSKKSCAHYNRVHAPNEPTNRDNDVDESYQILSNLHFL